MANVCAQTTIGKLSAYLLVVHTNLLTLQHKLSIQRARYGYVPVYDPDERLANELYRRLHVREARCRRMKNIKVSQSLQRAPAYLILIILISTLDVCYLINYWRLAQQYGQHRSDERLVGIPTWPIVRLDANTVSFHCLFVIYVNLDVSDRRQ